MRHDPSSNLTMNGCSRGFLYIVLSFMILHQRILLLPSISVPLLPSITVPLLPAFELFWFSQIATAAAAAKNISYLEFVVSQFLPNTAYNYLNRVMVVASSLCC